jgi:hypothetical protein
MNARRPLADANLVSRTEARVELGCSWKAVDMLLCRCRRYTVGKTPRYRWSEILERAAEPDEAQSVNRKPRKGGLAVVGSDWT